MAIHDMIVVSCIVAAFSAFGGVLGWVSWDESRRKTRK
jgi:hypothetical protein